MKLNKTLAVALHRAMWTDMRTELGDNPSPNQRACFKATWIKKYFPNENVMNNCFLCEYAHRCSACPIRWPEGRCSGSDFSYDTAPICDILALPEKDEKCADLPDACKKYVDHDETEAVRAYYKYREDLLSKASGLPGPVSVEDHVKAIKEKAVEEYFEKTPGAKLATMDVDQAFKQYADEQKAPIFHALAEASGLSADESVKAHISAIRSKVKTGGRKEALEDIFNGLSVFSGLSAGNWSVTDHVKAIQERAKKQDVALSETYRKSNMLLVNTLNKYKDELSDESGLDRNRPVGDHIKEIYYDAFSDGRDYEKERIMIKIKEMLNDKSARETKDS